MRVDQYLWCVRLFKSRNLASTACRKGQVTVNGQIVKPSREVLPSDQLKVRKDQIWHHLEVIAIPKSRVGAKLVGLYCFEKIDAEDLERTRLQQLAVQAQRDQGTERPTKKERREIDDLNQETSEEEIK